METQNPEARKQELLHLADQLDELQKVQHSGRGVSCVKEVIQALRQGNFEYAKAVATHDHDKIGSYPEIEVLMEEYGLCESYANFRKRFNKES